MLNKFLTFLGLKKPLMIGLKKFFTVHLSQQQELAYNLTLHNDEGDERLYAIAEIALPSGIADATIEYIRRATYQYGVLVEVSDKSDDYATKLTATIPFTPDFELAIQSIEIIITGSLDYQVGWIRSMYVGKRHFDYPSIQDLTYRLERVKAFYPLDEENRRQWNLITFKQIHYVFNGTGVNVLQTTSQVSAEYLISHLTMMEQAYPLHLGTRRLMVMTENQFTLHSFG